MQGVSTLEELLHQVKVQAAKRQRHLDKAKQTQLFQRELKDLLLWVEAVEERLVGEENSFDVDSAQALLTENQELKTEIDQQGER